MDKNNEFKLELSDETLKKVGEYAQKSGKSEDQVIEYILKEFIQDQLHVFAKVAEKKGKPLNEVLNKQFIKTVESLLITQK